MATTTLNIIFLITYSLSAAVQYNDPDALLWVAMYLTAAAMCVAQARHKQPRWLPPGLLLVSVAGIVLLLPNIVGQVSLHEIFASVTMQTRAVEEAREIGGLLLVVIWASVLTWYQRAR